MTAARPQAGLGSEAEDCFPQTPLRDCLIVIDVHSDINQQPYHAAHFMLVPGTGCCPHLVKHVQQFLIPGSLHGLVPVTIPPFILYDTLVAAKWYRYPFRLVAVQNRPHIRFPLTNSIHHQAGVASFFLQFFPALCLQSWIFSSGNFPWVFVC